MPICSHFCPGLSTSVLSTQMAALRLGISVVTSECDLTHIMWTL
ncbi:Uncharacterised protein [Salmonella enterica subsp. enterica]|uniref:Uncharacterized protein n=1 Tax=Salmonella enterica I TaxID=59201 RepID=A0A379WUP6_SALET|nr:Uncharacterised protein [Salmonella enterica subsp. enterica]